MVGKPVKSLRRTLLMEDINSILTISPATVERLPAAIRFPATD